MDYLDAEVIKSILLIISIDIALGGDNAIVIALASRNLPYHQRTKAIMFGAGLAIFVRIMLTGLAVYLLRIPYLKLIGGALLIYIALKLIIDQDDSKDIKAKYTLVAAIQTIVYADIIMGFDNVLAIAMAAKGDIILVIIGLLFSVPIIIWGSKIILYWMDKYPILPYIGASILAFTAGKTIVSEEKLSIFFESYYFFQYAIPLFSILIVFMLAGIKTRAKW